MWTNIGFERCLAFVNCQVSPDLGRHSHLEVKPAITISRMAGAGGHTVASKLAEYMQSKVPGHPQWTVFDRQLVEKVLADHNLSKRVSEYMPENHKPMLADMFEELIGLHPSAWTLAHQTADTILKIAQMGNVIVVGRGAAVVTRALPHVFHARLVGSLEKRLDQVKKVYGFDDRAAQEHVRREDKAKRRYLKEHFQEDIDNPLLYDLVLNTDRISHDDTARMIGDAVIHRFQLDRQVVATEA
jgi:cytidylate kinase